MAIDMHRLKLLASALVTVTGHFIAGGAEIGFAATIEQSPFENPGYNVGSTIIGSFQYAACTVPYAIGENYTDYFISNINFSFGSANYNAAISDVSIAHNVYASLYWPDPFEDVDYYLVAGFAFTGPIVPDLQPTTCSLFLIDADASVYANDPTPYPVTLPDLNQFESKLFAVTFSDSEVILCTIDSIADVPESSGLGLSLSAGFLAIVYQRRLFQKCASF